MTEFMAMQPRIPHRSCRWCRCCSRLPSVARSQPIHMRRASCVETCAARLRRNVLSIASQRSRRWWVEMMTTLSF